MGVDWTALRAVKAPMGTFSKLHDGRRPALYQSAHAPVGDIAIAIRQIGTEIERGEITTGLLPN